MNQRHKHTKFASEVEADNILPFLDVTIIRKATHVSPHRKPTFSRMFTNFSCFLPKHYKTDLYFTVSFIFHLFLFVNVPGRSHKLTLIIKRLVFLGT